jgi:hypothetical protein
MDTLLKCVLIGIGGMSRKKHQPGTRRNAGNRSSRAIPGNNPRRHRSVMLFRRGGKDFAVTGPEIESVIVVDESVPIIVESAIRFFTLIDPQVVPEVFVGVVNAAFQHRHHNSFSRVLFRFPNTVGSDHRKVPGNRAAFDAERFPVGRRDDFGDECGTRFGLLRKSIVGIFYFIHGSDRPDRIRLQRDG